MTRFRIRLLALVLGGACGGPTAPVPTPSGRVLVGPLESGRFVIVDLALRKVISQLGPTIKSIGALAATADRRTLYATLQLPDSTFWLYGFDLANGTITTEERTSDNKGFRRIIDGVQPSAGRALAASPTGEVAMASSVRGSDLGVAIVRTSPFTLLGAVFPLLADPDGAGAAYLAPTAALPGGGFIIVPDFRRTGRNPILVGGPTYAIVDSIPPNPALTSVARAATDTSGKLVFLVGSNNVVGRYEVETRRYSATTTFPFVASFTVLSKTQQVMAFDGGTFFDSPGSGKAVIYGFDLVKQREIDLSRSAAVGNSPPVLGRGAVSPDGSFLAIPTGTTSLGPLFGPQRSRLLIVSMNGDLLDAIDLNDWGTGVAFFLGN